MIGKTISHYKILEKLGEGGMGVVYKAEDTKLDRLVALKFLPRQFSINEEEKARFVHEAKASAALEHPNICNIHEISETEDGQMYIAMACYEGETLKEKLDKGPLKLDEAIDIAIQVAEGLNKAHKQDVIHRDIKSANIIITAEGVAKILDFGLAKLKGRTKLTKEGTTLGTVAYMSPEQTKGKEVDQPSDIWSLGVVLFEMISGQLPFKGEYDQAIMYSIMSDEPEPLTGLRTSVPMELERIIHKALKKDPKERYQHAGDLLVDLRNLQKEPSAEISEQAKHITEPIKKPSRKRWIPFVMGTFIIAIVAGYFILKKTSPIGDTLMQQAPVKESTPTVSRWKNSIAVLPFSNISADKDQDYFCDGMTEDIITKLTHIRDLKVISRTSAMRYKNSEKSIKDIGKELAVDNILEGSVRKEKNRIRITAQLIRVTDDANLWANNYDRQLESIFDVQDEVSKAIAQALEVSLTPETIKIFKNSQTHNLEAYEYYLKGTYIFNNKYLHTYNKNDFITAVRMLETALEIDPGYIGAYTGLVWIYTNHYIFKQDESSFTLAEKLSEKLKKFAPDSGDAYANLAVIYLLKHKYDQAYEYIKTAVAKIPNNALTNYTFGFFFHRVGLYQQAIKYCTRAMELDPLFLHPYLTTIRSLIYSRNYRKAEFYLKKVAQLHPDHPRVIDLFCRFNLSKKKYSQVQEWITKLENKHPTYYSIKRWKMILYAAQGEREKALSLQYQSSDGFALLGLKDEALARMQKNQDKNKYYYRYLFLNNNPHYDNIRDDPRFQKIVAEAKALYQEGLRKYRDIKIE